MANGFQNNLTKYATAQGLYRTITVYHNNASAQKMPSVFLRDFKENVSLKDPIHLQLHRQTRFNNI
jgi:hypothetical protein